MKWRKILFFFSRVWDKENFLCCIYAHDAFDVRILVKYERSIGLTHP